MLRLENLSFGFGDREVLREVSGVVRPGELVLLTGPNGAGKTTLFDLIAGKKRPQKGRVWIGGQDVTHFAEARRAKLLGRLSQDPQQSTVSSMSVGENVALVLRKCQRARLTPGLKTLEGFCFNNVASLIGCSTEWLLKQPMAALSGGQRQLIAFFMALAAAPKLLLLDEPTGALDEHASECVVSLVERSVKEHGVSALMITHDRDHIASNSRCWRLEKGELFKPD